MHGRDRACIRWIGWGAIAVWAAANAACLEEEQRCQSGIVCPVGSVCDDVHGGCVEPRRLAECQAEIDGTSCSYAGVPEGACFDGVCFPAGCGNGFMDEGELCDDGNTDSGDGCASDCRSNESCGNGVVDVARDESCDDGNTRDGDGCQSICVLSDCGDGIVDPDEICDDGNNDSGDGCRRDCLKAEVCGDNVVDDGEACDDGNANAADGCDACALTEWRAVAVVGGPNGLAVPQSIVADATNNLFIADSLNYRVHRIDSSTGTWATIAGNGLPGFSGDGGPATSGQIGQPHHLAVDGLGNLFIADPWNHRIRRVDAATGVITTVAGNGDSGSSGDGGPATAASLSTPRGVAVDGLGDLFIAEAGGHRIRRVDAETGIITTFAGTGVPGFSGDNAAASAAQLNQPEDLYVDSSRSLFVVDSGNYRIRQIDLDTGVIATAAGNGVAGSTGDGGPATSAEIRPRGLDVTATGDLLIAESAGYRVRRVDATTGVIETIAGDGNAGLSGDGGPPDLARLNRPEDVVEDSDGNIFIADSQNQRLRKIDGLSEPAEISTVAGSGALIDGWAATATELLSPEQVSHDGQDNLYIADTGNHKILRVDAATGAVSTVAQLVGPIGVTSDALGNLFVVDRRNNQILRVDGKTGAVETVAGNGSRGGYSGDGGPATEAELNFPYAVAIAGDGGFFISDSFNHRIRHVDESGTISTVAGTGSNGFSGDGGPATAAQINNPRGLAVDGDGNLYIADMWNDRVRRVDAQSGAITTVAGTGVRGFSGDGGLATDAQISTPISVVVDAEGKLFISERLNHRIRRVSAAGQITTLAGTGAASFFGDGGPSVDASLNSPRGLSLDSRGNLYVTDRDNNLVREIDADGTIFTVAGLVDETPMGPVSQARLADPKALSHSGGLLLIAGGTSGTVQALRGSRGVVEVVAGRYRQASATLNRARFRDDSFGAIEGLAYDEVRQLLYVSESSSNRLHVVDVVDPEDRNTWTIAPLAGTGDVGFSDGSGDSAQFRRPTALVWDMSSETLYVADMGNHVIRAIDLSLGAASASVATLAGTPETLGFFGDGGDAKDALFYRPQGLARCPSGDFFVSDTGNHRVRRIDKDGIVTTVLGDGIAASSGQGQPATDFPVNAPLGLACDAVGNLYVTSTTTIRMLPADDKGIVDGSGPVYTIYGAAPRDSFPAAVTSCLTDIEVVDGETLQIIDACAGMLIQLRRRPLGAVSIGSQLLPAVQSLSWNLSRWE